MGTMTFSAADDVVRYIEGRVSEDFPDIAAVVAELVRRDRERRLAELRQRVEESLASGVSNRTLADRIAEGDRILRAKGVVDG